jgi:molybdopterin-guanine dinucleotide biosynthesis protein B
MILGVYGYQDSGKTLLVERTVSELSRRGYRVASVKHSPHRKSADCEGKDTWRHWRAGSDPVVFSSSTETTVFKHSPESADDIVRMLEREYDPEVIILEGFKNGTFRKVSVGKIAARKNTILKSPTVEELVAYVEREVAVERNLKRLPGLDCHKCGLDCRAMAVAIADGKKMIDDCKELPTVGTVITVGGRRIVAGDFVARIIDDTIRGMLSSLKGYEPGKDVEIRLEAKRKPTKRRGKARK